MDQLANPEIWIALATLTALELVLGIDNIIFISILAGKLPPAQRNRARNIGILLAAVTRLALLMAIAWIVGLTAPLFSVFGHAFSWRDIILIGGGLRSEEHTSELQSLMRISYAVFCLKKKNN